MTWTNKHLNIGNDGIDNGDIQIGGATPNYIQVEMANGVAIKDGWGNTVSAGSTGVLWRKEFTATFTNYDALSSTQFGGNTLYYGISATDAGISIGTPSKNNTDYISYSAGYWSPLLSAAVTSDTTYQAKYTETYFCLIKVTSNHASQSINSTNSLITYSESGYTTTWRVPLSLGSVSITFKAESGYGFDSSGASSKTVTYTISERKTYTDTQNPGYAYITQAFGTNSKFAPGSNNSGWYAMGSTFSCVWAGYHGIDDQIETGSETLQVKVASNCNIVYDGTTSQNHILTSTVYKKRSRSAQENATFDHWDIGGTSVTSQSYSFSVSKPLTINVVCTSTGITYGSYSAWAYDFTKLGSGVSGTPKVTLPYFSSSSGSNYLTSRSVNETVTTTWKWSSSYVSSVYKTVKTSSGLGTTGSALTSPYTETHTSKHTYKPNNSETKWVDQSDTSKTYSPGADYIFSKSNIGTVKTLYYTGGTTIDNETGWPLYINIQKATDSSTTYTVTANIYNSSSYTALRRINAVNSTVQSFSLHPKKTLASLRWTDDSGTSVTANNSLYTITYDANRTYTINESVCGYSVTYPTFYLGGTSSSTDAYANVTCKYGRVSKWTKGSYNGTTVSAGTQTITANTDFYATIIDAKRTITIKNSSGYTMTILGSSVSNGSSITVSRANGQTSSGSITYGSIPYTVYAKMDDTSATNGVSISGYAHYSGAAMSLNCVAYNSTSDTSVSKTITWSWLYSPSFGTVSNSSDIATVTITNPNPFSLNMAYTYHKAKQTTNSDGATYCRTTSLGGNSSITVSFYDLSYYADKYCCAIFYKEKSSGYYNGVGHYVINDNSGSGDISTLKA
jgi:hypothetical protein